MIRLVASDVDGTMVRQDKVVTPATIEAARRLREAGVCLALGDRHNAGPMVRTAGHSIAMGNAPPNVTPEAKLHTATNEEDGCAAAVGRDVLAAA